MDIDVLKSKYKFLSEIYSIANDAYIGQFRPHKLLMLLSVLELMDQHKLPTNQIFYNEDLKSIYESFTTEYKFGNDRPSHWLPYYHLKTSSFWKHALRDGKEIEYKNFKMKDHPNPMLSLIDYAFLEKDIYDCLTIESIRHEIKRTLFSILNDNFGAA